MKLYTYVPKENTVERDGLLSTSLTDDGFRKYMGRTGKTSKEDVLRALDGWEPDWTRSKAVSALSEPIPEDARPDLVDFAGSHRLYSFDTKDLLKARILAALRETNKGRGTHPADEKRLRKLDWHAPKRCRLLFSGIPHFMVETKDGRIPPELVREEKTAQHVPSYERVRAQYARDPEGSLERLASRLAAKKLGPEDVSREMESHLDEFKETGEDKNLIDAAIIARIGQIRARNAELRRLRGVESRMRSDWLARHVGERLADALPGRLARFRQYADIPFPT